MSELRHIPSKAVLILCLKRCTEAIVIMIRHDTLFKPAVVGNRPSMGSLAQHGLGSENKPAAPCVLLSKGKGNGQ
jgi:hypothetical protein